MLLRSIPSRGWKANAKIAFVILSLFIFSGVTATNVSAITANEVMENVLEVYKDIDSYKASVQTFEAASMDVSPSAFEFQEPIISFNLFFRKPNEHAVEQIGKSHHGIFRVELLSGLGHMRDFDLKMRAREFLLGQECYVLEITPPTTLNQLSIIWVSPKDWTILQLTITAKVGRKSVDFVRTQFKYPIGGKKQIRYLPVETRSFFPSSKQVLINRITNYQVNTSLPSEVFEKSKTRKELK